MVEHLDCSDHIDWLLCTMNDRIEIPEDAKRSKRCMVRLLGHGIWRPGQKSSRCVQWVVRLFDILHADSTSARSIVIP